MITCETGLRKGTAVRRSKQALRWLMGVLFVLAGINHFLRRSMYMAIMPPYLPWHRALVDLSGYAEIVLGALVLAPQYARRAGWGLIALLIAVFPANLHMALNPERYAAIPPLLLWLRLPLQAVLIGAVDWCTRPQPRSAEQPGDASAGR
jgi:uncharacterized membrane protein